MIPTLYLGDIVFRVAEKEEIQYDLCLPQIKPTNPVFLIYAGKWVEYSEENSPEEWLARPTKLIDKRALAFKVEVDSMYPTLEPDEIIYVDSDKEPYLRDIAVVRLRSGESIIRRVRKKSEREWILQDCDLAYEPISIRPDQVKHICRVVLTEPR